MALNMMTTTPERRQVARVLTFAGDAAAYIDWNAIAKDARSMGASFEARKDDETTVVTLFWTDFAPLAPEPVEPFGDRPLIGQSLETE